MALKKECFVRYFFRAEKWRRWQFSTAKFPFSAMAGL
jgi:hypothetical protein